jgi:hypothetical protein
LSAAAEPQLLLAAALAVLVELGGIEPEQAHFRASDHQAVAVLGLADAGDGCLGDPWRGAAQEEKGVRAWFRLEVCLHQIGQSLRITGKRSKTRIARILPAIREAIDDYASQCRGQSNAMGRFSWALGEAH